MGSEKPKRKLLNGPESSSNAESKLARNSSDIRMPKEIAEIGSAFIAWSNCIASAGSDIAGSVSFGSLFSQYQPRPICWAMIEAPKVFAAID